MPMIPFIWTRRGRIAPLRLPYPWRRMVPRAGAVLLLAAPFLMTARAAVRWGLEDNVVSETNGK